jgi:hypothetical protein
VPQTVPREQVVESDLFISWATPPPLPPPLLLRRNATVDPTAPHH